jgi:histidine triad (HIT) family protein
MDCIFCRIVAGEIPSHKVYEDAETLAFLDIQPATRGHTLIVPKQHAADIFSITTEALAATARTSQVVARILQKGLQADGVKIMQNNGKAAGQEVFHYHVHVIPRKHGDRAVGSWRPGETDHAALAILAAELRPTEGT